MRVLVRPGWSAHEFACDVKACAPPPVGRGGSIKGHRGGRGGKTKNVEHAIRILGQGGTVTVGARKVSTLIKRLGEMSNEAAKAGSKAKTYDLCKVSIPGTNLFCGAHRGIQRVDMPQLSGKPTPGTPADKLPKTKKGRVDGTAAFEAHMIGLGVKITRKTVRASDLKATQMELIGSKVARMMNDSKFHPKRDELFVSRDGYIIDGHHRWAAQVGLDLKDGHLGDKSLRIRVVDMDIEDVIREANAFTKKFGISSEAA